MTETTKPVMDALLAALGRAEVRAQRMVTLHEVSAELTAADHTLLASEYRGELKRVAGRLMTQLVAAGEAEKGPRLPRVGNHYRTSGSAVPAPRSTSERVTDLFERVVRALDRPVRLGDVLAWADEHGYPDDLSREAVERVVQHLITAGTLRLVRRVRGGTKGMNLLLPARLLAEDFGRAWPLTRLERVAAHVRTLWDAAALEASRLQKKPKPLPTGAFRAQVAEVEGKESDLLSDPQLLVNALRHLAGGSDPVLRAVRRGDAANLLWAPANVPDEHLDVAGAFASDADRMIEAVRRAERHAGSPVTIREVRREIQRDRSLRLEGKQSPHEVLSDLTRPGLGSGRRRAHVPITRVARIRNRTYYSADARRGDQDSVRVLALREEWSTLDAEGRWARLQDGAIPLPLRIGRLMMLQAELEAWLDSAAPIAETGILAWHKVAARKILEGLGPLHESLRADACDLPSVVDRSVPGWTAHDALPFLRAVWPAAARLEAPRRLLPLLERIVRRVPNPTHTRRSSGEPAQASETRFDRTDLLMQMTRRWGDPDAVTGALMARHHLGRLRDEAFVLPLLRSTNPQDRAIGVACLLFLRAPGERCEALDRIAAADPIPSLRAAASLGRDRHLWERRSAA